MGHQSLYRRYRSGNFAEIKGQPVVTHALRSAVAEGRYGHAYLFSGPRGTGKTSTARVLAKALNCHNPTNGEPDLTCQSCLDIDAGKSFDLHELDAASNNKVDDIRELINRVALGSPGRTKVYILDEVHMLTPGAENALLKTLEEPPDHVVFVLATTEPQKVVATIRSRTQQFQFNLLPAEELDAHVRWVIEDAGLDVSEEGIAWALRKGGGSARDTLSALEMVAAAGGPPADSAVGANLVNAIAEKDSAVAIAAIQAALEAGREPRLIGEETLYELRQAFLAAMGASLDHLHDSAQAQAQSFAKLLGPATLTRSMEKLGTALVDLRQASDPRIPLEVAIIELTRPGGSDLAALLQRIEQLEATVAQLQSQPPAPQDQQPAPQEQQAAPPPPPPAKKVGPAQLARETLAQQKADAASTAPVPAPAQAPPPVQAPPPAPAPVPAAGGGAAVTLDGVVEAMTPLLEDLDQKIRARFRMCQPTAVRTEGSADTITFSLPNPTLIGRCDAVRPDVEQALGQRFQRQIVIEFAVDNAAPPPSAPVTRPREPDMTPPEDIGPIHELQDATDVSTSGLDKITKAFPGATLVDPPGGSR